MRHVITVPAVTGKRLKDVRGFPAEPGLAPEGPTISTTAVYVVYTTVDETLAAIRVAVDFAEVLRVPVTVVHVRTVPYTLPVDTPPGISPLATAAFAERLRREGLNVGLGVYQCRDERQAMSSAFAPHSLIVAAGRRRWWPTRAERMRRALEAAGHFVVFVDTAERGARGSREARQASGTAAATKEPSHA